MQGYDNMIVPIVDMLKYASPMSYDVLSYVVLAQLSTPSKDRLKQDGLNVSLWMHSLSSFCGNLYKKYVGVNGTIIENPEGWEGYTLVIVDEADRLVVNTEHEAQQLVSLHDADPDRIDVVHPGVDLQTFTPGDKRQARAALGLAADVPTVAFVGRIQPLKAPDVLLRAAARLPGVHVIIAGGPSGSGLAAPDLMVHLAD